MSKLKEVIKAKLKELKVEFVDSGSEWLLSQCLNPDHKDTKPSMFLHETGNGRCTSCGFTVHQSFFVGDDINVKELFSNKTFTDVITLLDSKYETTTVETTAVLPPKLPEVVKNYRGFSSSFLEKSKCFVCGIGRFENRIIFPFYDLHSNLIGYTGRLINNDSTLPKYLHSTGLKTNVHILYGQLIKELKLSTLDGLVLVEGNLDALALIQQGIPATPLLGFKQPTAQFIAEAIELGFDNFVLALDNDEVGHNHMYHKDKESKDVSLYKIWNSEYPTTLGYYCRYSIIKELYKSNYKDHHELMETKGL